MTKYKTLKFMVDESGDVLRSGITGEPIYYAIEWEELAREANKTMVREGKGRIDDVRQAGFAMDILGIPYQYTEADIEEYGDWMVYWR